MAGLMKSIIDKNQPKTSPYVDQLLERALEVHGEDSPEYRGIYHQYYTIPADSRELSNARHFQAEVTSEQVGAGLERMYRRVVVVDLVSACAAECSYCVRGYYDRFSLSNAKLDEVAHAVARDEHLREVLITGGDPLIAPRKLEYLIERILERAPNIRYVRIGTRLPIQAPERFEYSLLSVFERASKHLRVELASQINHPFELQEPTTKIYDSLRVAGVNLYSQNVLLKRVNDNLETMTELYDQLRYLEIAPHYMFHAVPLRGTEKYRTSVEKGLRIISHLSSSGLLSGRAKPQYALITDIGKVNLYHGSIVGTDGKNLRIRTGYRLEDRLEWNPCYVLPSTGAVNDEGTLDVLYPDGIDDAEG